MESCRSRSQCDAGSRRPSVLCSQQTLSEQHQLLLAICKVCYRAYQMRKPLWLKLKCQGDLSILSELCVLFPSKSNKDFTDEFMVLICQIIVMLDTYIFLTKTMNFTSLLVYHYQMEFCLGKYFISRQAFFINLETYWKNYAYFIGVLLVLWDFVRGKNKSWNF